VSQTTTKTRPPPYVQAREVLNSKH